jgi:hypothetical protein
MQYEAPHLSIVQVSLPAKGWRLHRIGKLEMSHHREAEHPDVMLPRLEDSNSDGVTMNAGSGRDRGRSALQSADGRKGLVAVLVFVAGAFLIWLSPRFKGRRGSETKSDPDRSYWFSRTPLRKKYHLHDCKWAQELRWNPDWTDSQWELFKAGYIPCEILFELFDYYR